MERRTLGKEGPEISVVGYGAWEAGGDMWGPNESDEAVVQAIHAALSAGMNWIDTAEVYGDGRSEELVGRAIRGRGEEVHLFTKVAPRPAGSGFRPEQVKAAIRGSLARLGADRVDLYQLHWPDGSVPVEETWGAMADLQDEGLALHIGVSNFDRPLIERCEAIRPVESVQNEFSLLYREDARRLLPGLAEKGTGYLAYGPLAYGLLTGAIRTDTAFHPRDWRSGTMGMGAYSRLFASRNLQANLGKVDRLRPTAERLGTSLAALALRWVVEQRGVTAAIAGSRNSSHVASNGAAGDLRLDEETLLEIEAIFA
ncbi:MAG: aldo/keto reductase [Actinobacteria bacterium]|nr:MAG: aldo/keto reductase [Actinomycetota bacterium]